MKGSCVLFLLNLKSKYVHFVLAQILRKQPKNKLPKFTVLWHHPGSLFSTFHPFNISTTAGFW
jgi:hypothetical protein